MNMNPEHLDAYLSGELRDDSVRFLEAAIRRDQTLQAELFEQAQFDQALRRLFADADASDSAFSEHVVGGKSRETMSAMLAAQADEFADGVIASVSTGDEDSLARSVLTELLDEREQNSRPSPWWDLGKAAAVAAVAVLMTVVALKSVEVADEKVAAKRAAVEKQRLLARITREDGAVWGARSTISGGEKVGTWLGAGLLHLESGRAEVTFDNGARAILEGPCYLDIETTQRAFLRRGRVTVEVPTPAIGFVVNTPSMNVVDLGTRFGVTVEANGVSELHVMEGEVEASRNAGRSVPVLLREGLAVRADRRTQSQLQPIEYAGDQFALRAGDARVATPPTVHYRFDESAGPALEDSGRGFAGGPFEATLQAPTMAPFLSQSGDSRSDSGHASAGSGELTPRRSAGRAGSGLVFRSGESLVTSMPASLDALSAHTIALWIKLPPQRKAATGASIVQLGAADMGQPSEISPQTALSNHDADAQSGDAAVPLSWQLSCNAEGSDGPLGALRVSFGEGYVIGTTDLRDGRWHHIATRFAGVGSDEDSADVATHVRLFVDGKVEPMGAARSGRIPPADSSSAPGSSLTGADKQTPLADGGVFFQLGAPLDPLDDSDRAGFEGAIDEVVICGDALDAGVIFQLVERPDRRGSLLFLR